MRISAGPGSHVEATQIYSVARLVVVLAPTRILEAILGVILLLVSFVAIATPNESALLKPPFTIAAQMSLFATVVCLHVSGSGRCTASYGRTLWTVSSSNSVGGRLRKGTDGDTVWSL
ncbi:hypothetical protein EXIGLDRAFT_784839 [Exidia glandulosa HHB12029]|uniref:Uncharacterized protein n=1 Tax=Exidia glandulosa HHB12029 TaxID=1314781 RepID=A0A166M9D4_EXIGL|nr:hypothetical protein EXIGLDRAFT_784839 [Exidia glandulosa HHB12029]